MNDYNSAMNNPQYSRLVQYIRRLEDNLFKTCTSKVWSCGFGPTGLLSKFIVAAYWLLFQQDEYFSKLADKYQQIVKDLQRTCESQSNSVLCEEPCLSAHCSMIVEETCVMCSVHCCKCLLLYCLPCTAPGGHAGMNPMIQQVQQAHLPTVPNQWSPASQTPGELLTAGVYHSILCMYVGMLYAFGFNTVLAVCIHDNVPLVAMGELHCTVQ